jgi:CheY-like chemotaxis protein
MNPTAPKAVLYVEDEKDDVFFMRKAFKRAGIEHALQSVNDGHQAIDYMAGNGKFSDREKHPLPLAILLDLNLPSLSGFEVLEWLKGQPDFHEIPVIILSSSGRPEDRAKADKLGADGYMLKPGSGLSFLEVAREFQNRWLT